MGNKEKMYTKQELENARKCGTNEMKSAILQLLDLQEYGLERKLTLSEDYDERKKLELMLNTYESVIDTIRGIIL